ncbi:unnamed protein product [Lampetra fluviatilis]
MNVFLQRATLILCPGDRVKMEKHKAAWVIGRQGCTPEWTLRGEGAEIEEVPATLPIAAYPRLPALKQAWQQRAKLG